MRLSGLIRLGKRIGLSTIFLLTIPVSAVRAQIAPDGTLESAVQQIQELMEIDGGQRAGDNLFHSFSEFNIPEGMEAAFQNAVDVENIFTRVTGDSISNINGTLSTQGLANFFLMNPNGIVFGQNASINVGGSFIATTADSIQFDDGTEFATTDTNSEPILSVGFPAGLGFGSNSGSITVNGTGNEVTPASSFLTPITVEENANSLSVQPENTLALIGNEIDLNGARLEIDGGRIELASVDSGLVNLQSSENGFAFNYDDVANYQDITLDNLSVLNASGSGEGNISLNAANVAVEDGSLIFIQNQGNLPSGTIEIDATESLTLSGTSPDGNVSSAIFSEALESGKAADLNISTQKFVLRNAGALGSVTYADAPSGEVNINSADSVQLLENTLVNPDRTSIVFSSIGTASYGEGNSGNLQLTTSKLDITSGATVVSATSGTGNSGNITVNAEKINISGINSNPQQPSRSTIASSVVSGDASSITINTSQLRIQDGGVVSASSTGNGNAGELKIDASQSIDVSGENNVFSSSINSDVFLLPDGDLQESANAPTVPTGQGGNLTIDTPILNVNSGGEVSVANQGSGNAGLLSINAKEINLDDSGSISASTASGQGGNINLNSENIELLDQSQITASAGGAGNGGNITIDTETLLGLQNSDITANAVEGNGGNIEITADSIVGFVEREQLTPFNDITASSEFGTSGTVTINSPESSADEDVEVAARKVEYEDFSRDLAQSCRQGESMLVYSGMGVPQSPGNYFDNPDYIPEATLRRHRISGGNKYPPLDQPQSEAHRRDLQQIRQERPKPLGQADNSQRSNQAQEVAGVIVNPEPSADNKTGKSFPIIYSRTNDIPPRLDRWRKPGSPRTEANAVQINPDGNQYLVKIEQIERAEDQVCVREATGNTNKDPQLR